MQLPFNITQYGNQHMQKTQLNAPQIKQMLAMNGNEVTPMKMAVNLNVSEETINRYLDMYCPKPEPEPEQDIEEPIEIPRVTTKKKVKGDDK